MEAARAWIVRGAVGSLVVASAVGCMPAVATTGPQHVRNTDVAMQGDAVVPAGTMFVAIAESPIDTLHSMPGQSVRAIVQTPLFATDGRLMVRAGAVLRGTLASVGNPSAPRLRVSLDAIETVHGEVPLQAAIRRAQHRDYNGPAQAGYSPSVGFDGYAYGWDVGNSYPGSWGGGPVSSYGYGYYNPVEVHIPRGARMQFVLTRPLTASTR